MLRVCGLLAGLVGLQAGPLAQWPRRLPGGPFWSALLVQQQLQLSASLPVRADAEGTSIETHRCLSCGQALLTGQC